MNDIFKHPFLLKPIGRMDYLLSIIAIKVLQVLVLIPLGGMRFGHMGMMGWGAWYGAELHFVWFFLLELVLSVALFVFASKRLRDIRESQYLLLLFLIPFANVIFSIYLIFKKGKHPHHAHHEPHHHHETHTHVHDQES